jgi:hypothetical protein
MPGEQRFADVKKLLEAVGYTLSRVCGKEK